MSDRMKAFWLGIFILGAIAIIGWLLLFLEPTTGDGRVKLRVRFSNVDKVSKGTRVTYGGKAVGEVVKIEQVDDPRAAPVDSEGNLYMYELELKVDSIVDVYTYDEIIFSTSGLLGEKSIAITPRAPPPGAPPAQNVTDQILYADSYDKLEETLNQMVTIAQEVQDSASEIGNFFSDNSEAFHTVLTSFTDERGSVGRFLRSADFYEQVSSVMYQLDQVLRDINNYGIFFQFNSKWRRCRDARLRWMEACCECEMEP